MVTTWRACAIGSTRRGDFGHGMDMVFHDLEGFSYVAIADDNPDGLAAAGKRAGIDRLYPDYRKMLEVEKPEVVVVGPRWTDQHVAMIQACAEAGSHVFTEKPMAGTLTDADAILKACRDHGVQISVAHQNRAFPTVRRALELVQGGQFGNLLRMHATGKEDARGGGEDLIVLGTHLFDLMTLFAGPPTWVSAYVSVKGRPAIRADAKQGREPVGPIAGDTVSVMVGFAKSVVGTFHSRADAGMPGKSPFGITFVCEGGMVCIRSGEVATYASPTLLPESTDLKWEKIWVEDWHFTPEHKPRPMNDILHRGNRLLVADLKRAVDEKRPPTSSGSDAIQALEIIQGVYASHLAGGERIAIPQAERAHPLS